MKELNLTETNMSNMKNKAKLLINIVGELKVYAKSRHIFITDAEMDTILKRIMWD